MYTTTFFQVIRCTIFSVWKEWIGGGSFCRHEDWCWTTPSFLRNECRGCFHWGQSSRSLKLTTLFYLVLTLRTTGAVLLLLLQAFMLCKASTSVSLHTKQFRNFLLNKKSRKRINPLLVLWPTNLANAQLFLKLSHSYTQTYVEHLNCKLYYQQLQLKYLNNLASYWLQAPWRWNNCVKTRRSVIICEIIAHLLVIVQDDNNNNKQNKVLFHIILVTGVKQHPISRYSNFSLPHQSHHTSFTIWKS